MKKIINKKNKTQLTKWILIFTFIMLNFGFAEKSHIENVCELNIALSQGLGYDIDKNSGELKEMDQQIANRDGVIIVESKPMCFTQFEWHNAEVILKSEDNEVKMPIIYSNNKKALFEVTHSDMKKGEFTLSAKVGNKEKVEIFENIEIKTQSYLIVPLLIQCKFEGCEVNLTDKQIQVWENELIKRFPVDQEGINLTVFQKIDIGDKVYDLDTWFGRLNTWVMLKQLLANTSYDALIAIVPEYMNYNQIENALSGFTFGSFTTVILMQGDETAITMAHEISHFYQVGDEYAGGNLNPIVNMPPYLVKGQDLLNPGKITEGTSRYLVGGMNNDEEGTGTIITSSQIPYDVIEHHLINKRMTSYMGKDGLSLEKYWTTGDIWNHLLKEWRVKSS